MRLARVEVAAVITRRAKSIADASGLVLTAPPLKFLAPFYEKASLEEAEDADALENWAQLLVSASTGSNSHPHFISILSELETSQALMLKDIFDGTGILHNEIEDDGGKNFLTEIECFNAILNRLSERDFNAIVEWAVSDVERPVDRIVYGIRKRFTGKGVFCAGMLFWFKNSSAPSSYRREETERHLRALDRIDVDVLESLNLISHHTFAGTKVLEGPKKEMIHFRFDVYSLTDMALKFLSLVDADCRSYLNEERQKYERRFQQSGTADQ